MNKLGHKLAKQLDRTLGFWSVFTISLAAMIGTGIFVLPGLAAGYAGPLVWISYLLAGLIVLPAVFSKAELVTAMPVSGGAYVYIDRSMGPWLGTITGLGTWLALSAKTAFALVGLGAYLVIFTDLPPLPFSLFVLGFLIFLNILGVGKVSGVQKVIVGICLVALLFYCIAGVAASDPALREPMFPTGSNGIIAGAGLVFAAYAGVTKICSVAEEVQNPSRNLPLGMISAQLTVMVLYMVVAWVITSNISYTEIAHDSTPITTAGAEFLGSRAFKGMAIVSVLGLISMCNAGILATSRFPFAMSRDNLVPSGLARIHDKFHTPINSILTTGVLLVLLVTCLPLITLAKLASGFKIFIFSLNHLAVIILRESNANWYKPTFRSPFYPWNQIFGILAGLWLLTYLGWVAFLGVIMGIIVGTAWYFAYGKKRVSRKSAIQHLWGEARVLRETQLAELEEQMTDQAPRVIVPVFDEEDVSPSLIRLGTSFVDVGLLEVTHFTEVPDQVMLIDHARSRAGKMQVQDISEEICSEVGVALDFHDIVTHNAKRALMNHADATNAQWLLVNWPRRNEHSWFVRDHMAWWFDHPPCDLAVFLDRGATRFKKVMVYAEPGPYDSLIATAADRIASQEDSEVTIFGIVAENADENTVAVQNDYLREVASMMERDVSILVVKSSSREKGIAGISSNYDLLIMGAHPEGSLRTLFFGSIEHRLAEQAECSVLRLKTPRDRVHERFTRRVGAPEDPAKLRDLVNARNFVIQSSAKTKEEMFGAIAQALGKRLETAAEPIASALMQREKLQSTALTGGLSLMAATCETVTETSVSILTTTSPVDFRGPGRRRIDLLVAVVSPSDKRQEQLWILSQFAQMALRSDFLHKVRESRDPDELYRIITDLIDD